MKIKAQIIIYLSVLVLVGLITTQFLIVKNSLEIEHENMEIKEEIKALEEKN